MPHTARGTPIKRRDRAMLRQRQHSRRGPYRICRRPERRWIRVLLRQYLYFCASKASNLSTWILVLRALVARREAVLSAAPSASVFVLLHQYSQ
jgi:hypothetical protein